MGANQTLKSSCWTSDGETQEGMKGPAMGVLENVQFGVGKQPMFGAIEQDGEAQGVEFIGCNGVSIPTQTLQH